MSSASLSTTTSNSRIRIRRSLNGLQYPGELEEPGVVVSQVEARVQTGRGFASSRAKAAELHREADRLFYKGDLESALVLYKRAARLNPRELGHAVAARRVEGAITSAARPASGRSLLDTRRGRRSAMGSAVSVSTEVAALRAKDIVAEAEDPVKEIPRILKFFDARKDYWRLSSPTSSPRRTRSRLMLRQLNRCVKLTVKDVESACEAGDTETVRKLSDELVNLISLTEDASHNQVDTCGYLTMKQLMLGRHDRAVDMAAKMIFMARTSNDVVSMVKALRTLGKVHLQFGHVDALVKVWERLVGDLDGEAIAQSWLYHDIGRCHLELGNYPRSLDAARRCLQCAQHARSKKWTLRAQLLSGQCLLKQGRYAEAVAALTVAATIAEEEGDAEGGMLEYIQSLIDDVTRLLRRLNSERESRTESMLSLTKVLDKDEESARDGKDAKEENLEEQRRSDIRIAQLLEKTRTMGSRRSARDKSAEVLEAPAATAAALLSEEEKEADLGPDTSRTRIIRRGEEDVDSDEERTLRSGELCVLSDVSCVDEDLGESDFASARREEDEDMADARSGVYSPSSGRVQETNNNEEEEEEEDRPVSYFSPDDQMTSRSFALSPSSEPTAQELSKRPSRMSLYLQNLESRGGFDEVLQQEQQ